jgi:hypothetical protein
MLTCLQKNEYDNFVCEKEVADFYGCVKEFQVFESFISFQNLLICEFFFSP